MDMYCCGPGQIDPDDKMHLNFNTEIKPKLTDWETIQNKPTTLEGYGITDAAKATDIPKPSSTSPKMSGIATVGKETAFARGDHVHPSDATKANADEVYKKTETYSRTEIDEKGFLTEHQDISGKADKATTLAGYGITDAYTKTELDGKLSSTYKPGGNMLFANLPQPNANNLGLVYSMMDAFTTDDRFIASEPTPYPIGTNVVCVQIMIEDTPTYLYDVLSGFVDLSDYPTKPEVASQLETKQNKITGQAGQYVGFDTGGNAVPRPAPVMVTSFNGRTGAIVPQAEDYPLTLIGAADRTLSNLSNYQKALRNIGGRPNRNLLDNWYFVGGGSQQGGGQFPINQRGQTSYTNVQTTMYTIDRWILGWGITMTITESGLVFDPFPDLFQQINPVDAAQIIGKLITITALDSENHLYTVSAVYNGTNEITDPDVKVSFTPNRGGKPHSFWIRANNAIAAKLEFGDHQTLAYQDEDGNWQLFETPDFQEELAKCQAYQVVIPTLDIIGCTNNATTLYANIPTPVPMRAVPSIENNGVFIVRGNGTNRANLTASIYSTSFAPQGIRVGIAGEFSPNVTYAVNINGQIILNANL